MAFFDFLMSKKKKKTPGTQIKRQTMAFLRQLAHAQINAFLLSVAVLSVDSKFPAEGKEQK